MKKLGGCVAAMFFGILVSLPAQDMKIGFVDVEKVFNEYQVTQQNDAKLKDEGKSKTAERNKLVDEIKKLKDEAELLSEEARKEKEAAIDERLKALREFDEKTKGELRDKRDFLLKKIFDDIKVTIEQMGKEEGYTFIYNDRALLYKSEAFDLTPQVTKRLNEAASKKAEQAPAEAQP